MKRSVLLAICLLIASFSSSQIYRAGEEVSAATFPHWEVAVGWDASTGEVTLKNGSSSSDGQSGFYGRVLYAPYRRWAIGMEGTLFSSQAIHPIVRKYNAQRLGVLLQYRLTPQTNPRVYLLAGSGVTLHEFKFVAPYRDDKDVHTTSYLAAGAGLMIDVWKDFFIAAEMRGIYNMSSNLNLFYRLSKRWESEGKLLVGVHF